MMVAFSSNKDMREAMDLPRNNFKHALAGQQMQIGLWSTLCSHIGAEIVADCGFDWVLLDTEHSPSDIPILVTQMQAMMRGTATPVVRPAWNDIVLIKRILDAGATSLLIPFVQDADEARRAVAATRYPPLGIRGVSGSNRAARYGRIKDYLHRANQEICVLVQIETASALEKLEAIAAVEGVDGVFIGPADLAASLGHTGDQLHPTVQAAIQDAGRRLKKVGKAAGILTPVEADAKRYITWGYTFVAVGSDTGLLIKAGDALARTFKG